MTKYKVGTEWKNAEGKKAVVVIGDIGGKYPVRVLHDGNYYIWHDIYGVPNVCEDKYTLISEWNDHPETGTLSELNVQVGDVVEFSRAMVGHEEYSYLSGTRMTVRQDGGVSFLDPKWGRIDGFTGDCGHVFRIVSRAKPQGPVITETVTRKRIVPGVYGGVEVLKLSDGALMFGLVHDLKTAWVSPNGNMVGPMSRDDLTAAIETLTQIRDAMSV